MQTGFLIAGSWHFMTHAEAITLMPIHRPKRYKKPQTKARPVERRKDQRAASSAAMVSSIMCAEASYPIRDHVDMRMPDRKANHPLLLM